MTTASCPARVVGYDIATGFGLVQPLAPLKLEPVAARQRCRRVGRRTADGRQRRRRRATSAWRAWCRAGRSPATGNTTSTARCSPRLPRGDHSGAALFNGRGELVGIGSLIVADALGPGRPAMPGNMFVPVDLLKPILAELRQRRSLEVERARLARAQLRRARGRGARPARQRRQPGRRRRRAGRRPHRAYRRRGGTRARAASTRRCGAAARPSARSCSTSTATARRRR